MAANNYARYNLKTVYSVLENDYDDNFNFYIEYQDLRDDILNMTEIEFSERKDLKVTEKDGNDSNRNYMGNYVFEVVNDDDIGVRGKITNGYYSGANLEIEYIFNDYEYDNIENIIYDLSPLDDEHKAKTIKDMKYIIDGVERVYKKVSQPLEVQGAFSNGSTLYCKK